MSECRKDLNEECVSLNEYAKHGTCQCKAGFKRNFDTFMCESFDLKTYLAGANKMENYVKIIFFILSVQKSVRIRVTTIFQYRQQFIKLKCNYKQHFF